MVQLHIHYLAVIVCAIVMFGLGGLWYSVLFTKKWVELMNLNQEKMKTANMPVLFGSTFIFACVTSHALACVISLAGSVTFFPGASIGFLCWLGFAGLTSLMTSMFSGQPTMLWAINSGYNLVSFVIAGGALAVWQ